MSAALGAADISAGHEPRQQADPPDRRQHGFTAVCCTAVMVAVICAILGFPCAPTGVAVLDSVPVFRCTCVGFAAFTALGAVLPRRGAADVSFRIAITFNSLAFWWVTFAWCMDDYSWWGLLVLEHAFIALAVAMFLRGKGMLAQLAFTALGALTGFVRSSERDDLGAEPLSTEDEEVWVTTVLAVVSMLVACMMAARSAVFKKQPGATAARVTPEPKEEAWEAWAGVVPAGLIPAGRAPVVFGTGSTDLQGPSPEQSPLSSEQPSEQQGHTTLSSGALRGVSGISSAPASLAGAGAGGAAPSGPDLSVPED